MDGHSSTAGNGADASDETATDRPGTARTVVVNGEPRSTRAGSLAALLIEAGYGESKVATALNGDFVPERARASAVLEDGDRIEIVAPRQGG